MLSASLNGKNRFLQCRQASVPSSGPEIERIAPHCWKRQQVVAKTPAWSHLWRCTAPGWCRAKQRQIASKNTSVEVTRLQTWLFLQKNWTGLEFRITTGHVFQICCKFNSWATLSAKTPCETVQFKAAVSQAWVSGGLRMSQDVFRSSCLATSKYMKLK